MTWRALNARRVSIRRRSAKGPSYGEIKAGAENGADGLNLADVAGCFLARMTRHGIDPLGAVVGDGKIHAIFRPEEKRSAIDAGFEGVSEPGLELILGKGVGDHIGPRLAVARELGREVFFPV